MNRQIRLVLEAASEGRVTHQTRGLAAALLAGAREARARKLTRTLPGRKAKAASGAVRRARLQSIRDALLERSGGRCEACRARDGSEAHHLLSGPLRRYHEAPDTMVWLCLGCHRDAHGDPLEFWRNLSHSPVWFLLDSRATSAVVKRAEKAAPTPCVTG